MPASDVRNTSCGNCGHGHQPANMEECPTRGRMCNECKKINYFSAVCRQKVVHNIDPPDTNDDNKSDISGEFYIGTVNSQQRPGMCLACNNKTITSMIDTSAQVNILAKAEFDKPHTPQSLKRSKVTLHGYGGHKLSNLGVCKFECSHKSAIHNLQFHVVDVRAPPILGLKSCVDMKLVKFDDIGATFGTHRQFNSDDVGLNVLLTEYSDLFDGIGEFPGEHSLTLHPSATGTLRGGCTTGLAFGCSVGDKVKQEFTRMEKFYIQ